MKNNITIIGSGNVATQLGSALQQKGFSIQQVISRNLLHAKKLAKKLNCKAFDSIENTSVTNIYLIAVNDDSIALVAKQLHQFFRNNKAEKPLLIHTSGAVGIDKLDGKNVDSAVLYPLQTIKKNATVHFENVPLIYFSNDASSLKKVKSIARSLSNNTVELNDEQRVTLHIAAVFTNNFTNHMVSIAQSLCEKSKIDFNLLQPLLTETFEKLKSKSASKLQTGPAIRNDENTIDKHLKLLKSGNEVEIYKVITRSIKGFYQMN